MQTNESATEQATAKLFMNGRSQAVRLPKEFRFEGEEVFIHKKGDSVVLTPRPMDAATQSFIEFIENIPPLPDDFLSDEFLASLRNDPAKPEDIF